MVTIDSQQSRVAPIESSFNWIGGSISYSTFPLEIVGGLTEAPIQEQLLRCSTAARVSLSFWECEREAKFTSEVGMAPSVRLRDLHSRRRFL